MEDGDSMTLEEFQYIKRAVEALESPETTPMASMMMYYDV